MELREEAWSPGPLDSEDQQMASHENPGEVASAGVSELCPHPRPVSLGAPILPAEAPPGLGRVCKFPSSCRPRGRLLTSPC